jgi:hypothetical protein
MQNRNTYIMLFKPDAIPHPVSMFIRRIEMSENTSLNHSVLSSEAPASWNTRYQTPEGFVCQITLRGDTGKDLLEKANAALTWLKEKGFQPGENYSFRPRNNNSKQQANTNHETTTCPIHNVEMKRYEKDGKVWFSHKVEDGWCTGKTK